MKVGDTIMYPLDDERQGWRILTDIPGEVAWAWVLATCPEAKPPSWLAATAQEALAKGEYWPDKKAVVVGMNLPRTEAVAIYNHDGRFSLIARST